MSLDVAVFDFASVVELALEAEFIDLELLVLVAGLSILAPFGS